MSTAGFPEGDPCPDERPGNRNNRSPMKESDPMIWTV